ncbi:MAG TPA: DUF4189 domain-containing protein [Kofleriaceae bacterium]|jgi:serine/threonine-protein kinase
MRIALPLLASLALAACGPMMTGTPYYHHYGWGNHYYEPAVQYPVAQGGDGHGAIAYSPSTGRVGWAFSKSTRWHATRDALQACGVGDCQIQVWEHGQTGVLVKAEDGSIYTGYGPVLWSAENWAMNRCSSAGGVGCHVERFVEN